MSEKSTTYPITCLMSPGDVFKVQEMLTSHPEFAIKITVINGGTGRPKEAEKSRPDQVSVRFEMPREGADIADFYRKFAQALNER